jgi:hypothetical protein
MAVPYGEISSITQKFFVPKLVDNIFNSNALFQRARSKWWETIDGGTSVMVPLAYATTTASGSYAGYDTLNTTANDQISAAEFFWKQYYASIAIDRLSELQNSGKEQMVDFVKAKVQLAEKSLADLLGTALFNVGTATKDIIGLRLAVDNANSSYGGVDRTTNSWWKSQVDSTTTSLSMSSMRTLMGQCTIDNDRPTVLIGTQAIYDSYYGLLQPQQRFQDSETASGGFTNVLFDGKPLIVDSHSPSGYLWMLNENYLGIKVHKDENFRFEPFQKPINQNVAYAKVYLALAMYTSNARMHGKMTAIT